MFSQEDINKINNDSLKYMVEVKECQELKLEEAVSVLQNLSLKWLTIGDYVVVMNSQVDATIGGEPYLALQLWFNVKSGKVIRRIWDQTVALEKVNNGKEFREACMSHFNGRPCIGNLTHADVNEASPHDFVISQTPVPRRISRSCEKVLDVGTIASIKSCPECLKFDDPEVQTDDIETCDITEKLFNGGGQRGETEEHMITGKDNKYEPYEITSHAKVEGLYSCDYYGNIKVHSKNEEQDIMKLEEGDMSKMVTESPSGPTPKSILREQDSAEQEKSQYSDKTALAIRLSYERYKSYMKKHCEICGKTIGLSSFADHMLKQHGMHGPFYKQCDWCDKKVRTNSVHSHSTSLHFFGRFLCEKCPFMGSFAKEITEHTKEVHGEHNSAKCPSCKKVQPINDLENHYKSCISRVTKVEKRMCETCGKILLNSKRYSYHIRTHLREQANADDLYHHCDKCDKKFSDLSYLKHHIKSVHENFEYKCSSCPLACKTKWKLEAHKIIVHSTDEKYQCKFCGKRCRSVDHRKTHELSHEDAKFQCKFCPKKLKSPLALKAHERHHTGETPFKCQVCDAGFVSMGLLNQHIRGVHKIAGPRGGKTGWVYGKTKTKENITE